ncbi:MAG TPA: GTP-binding protein [Vitreimonas sp.]|uniref:sulfate adenylyltransferase subunit 1 n=1 Tax=Vitreimonas sp. TaxID=3069702 RepID=UPI002D24C630|nr:GTP-binding protein [Vitreimonas sp.]HYD86877.1 GTP-binding protein [Vitreimonas sp.]
MDAAGLSSAVIAAPGAQIRFMTAGSVDDGKSTLIGRLLLDSGALMRDQVDTLGAEDLANLTDGLEAERAQGITIDVAYRYFATPQTSFVIADAPGHEQYTRNMVTAASNSDLAVLVIDATRVVDGVLRPQTRRHATIAALMGLDLIVAVNKMDALGWSQERFEDVRAAVDDLAGGLGLRNVRCIPISAQRGDNVVRRGGADWWAGPTLIELIKRSHGARDFSNDRLRMPIQTLLRDGAKRLYAGRMESGVVRPGDTVAVGAAKTLAAVARVCVAGRPAPMGVAGDSIAIELTEERDAARGDVIADVGVRYVRSVTADLCWLDEDAWVKGRRYQFRQGALETQALIEDVHFVRDVADLSERPAPASLRLNDIASVRISTRDPILADLYRGGGGPGAFVLFDPQTNQTCAAGMIREAL